MSSTTAASTAAVLVKTRNPAGVMLVVIASEAKLMKVTFYGNHAI